jgi:hypothetical protein
VWTKQVRDLGSISLGPSGNAVKKALSIAVDSLSKNRVNKRQALSEVRNPHPRRDAASM